MADLNAASVDDVAAFFKTYYAPNNAVIAIVGDVNTKTTLAKIEKYFGAIPRSRRRPPWTCRNRRRRTSGGSTLDDALARLPRIDMAYKVPPSSSPDDDALNVMATVLSGGRSSRFYEAIVRQKQLSTGVSAFGGETRAVPASSRSAGQCSPGRR